jgi:hypothetical protein
MLGDSELEVKVIAVSDPLNVILLSGHKRGVRSASWHPAGEILVGIIVPVLYCLFVHSIAIDHVRARWHDTCLGSNS